MFIVYKYYALFLKIDENFIILFYVEVIAYGSIKMDIQKGLTGTAFENGLRVVKNRGLAIIGMSLGNSYFIKDGQN